MSRRDTLRYALRCVWVIFLAPAASSAAVGCGSGNATDAEEAAALSMLLARYDDAKRIFGDNALAEWNYSTNLTSSNQQRQLWFEAVWANYTLVQAKDFNESFPNWKSYSDVSLRRALRRVTNVGYMALPPPDFIRFSKLKSDMERLFSTTTVCKDGKNPMHLDLGLSRIMAKSRDYEELLWAWKSWHDATGHALRPLYEEFVPLVAKAAVANDHPDTAKQWQSDFDYDTSTCNTTLVNSTDAATFNMTSPYNLTGDVERLFNELKPFYNQLHLYVKNKLTSFYGRDRFPVEGHIPAHILGDMWSQEWQDIMELVQPYNVTSDVNFTAALANMTVRDMFEKSEEFFVSLGLRPMPAEFWERSMLTKPLDRDVVCHPSAWNLFNGSDVRIKMCTDKTMDDFLTIHHEMGHIQYYLSYNHLPPILQDGANPAFHEAVGEAVALSVMTPRHLHNVGLLEGNDTESNETDINFLMRMALKKVAFLPFAKLVDDWRGSVFIKETPPSEYNKKWWDLKCKYQGVSPPVRRTEADFDPASLYHISSNIPYTKYFLSTVLQFQFHRAMCVAANRTAPPQPLHRCDIYGSRDAGDLLRGMMALGASRPWPDALEQLTGDRTLDISAMLEYFSPLLTWLNMQNAGMGEPQWNENGCPVPTDVTLPSGRCMGPPTTVVMPHSGGHRSSVTSYSAAVVLLLLAAACINWRS